MGGTYIKDLKKSSNGQLDVALEQEPYDEVVVYLLANPGLSTSQSTHCLDQINLHRLGIDLNEPHDKLSKPHYQVHEKDDRQVVHHESHVLDSIRADISHHLKLVAETCSLRKFAKDS